MALRIALLTYATKPRGSVVHTLELASALRELGHEPVVFALDKDGKGFHRAVDFETYAVPASPCDQGIDALIKQRIGEFVDFFVELLGPHSQQYDVYHAQDCLSANALAILRDQNYLPHFVRTVHHVESFRSPYLQDCQEKSIYLPDRCCVVSEQWQQALKREYGVVAHRVTNGVSKRFSPVKDGSELALRRDLQLGAGPIYLTVGGIEPRKNSINLLEAFALVKRQQPTSQLIIAGGATLFDYQDYRDAFMQRYEQLVTEQPSMTNSLVLPGVIDDAQMPALYRLADGFVFPSVKEGWGLVVLEAIASGLRVVTSDQPPFTEFLTGALVGNVAELVDPEDVGAIAVAMMASATLSHRKVESWALGAGKIGKEKIGDRARLDLLDCYSWRRSARMHLALYEQLLSGVL